MAFFRLLGVIFRHWLILLTLAMVIAATLVAFRLPGVGAAALVAGGFGLGGLLLAVLGPHLPSGDDDEGWLSAFSEGYNSGGDGGSGAGGSDGGSSDSGGSDSGSSDGGGGGDGGGGD